MILVVANVYVQDGKQDEFLTFAKKCIDGTVKEEGNISYELNLNAFESNRFTFVEKWQSKEALDMHMKTDHFGEFGKNITGILAKELEIEVFDANQVN